MKSFQGVNRTVSGLMAALLVGTMAMAPLAGCGSGDEYRTPPPPVDDTLGGNTHYETQAQNHPQASQKMSTGKKMVILAGAAALYYMYKKHQNAQVQHGPESQYYLSKNGRVYYRDAEGRAHWVTPPPQGIPVPESEAAAYSQFQGYQGRADGMDLSQLAQSGMATGYTGG